MNEQQSPASSRRRRKRNESRGTRAEVIAFTENGGLTRVMLLLAVAFVLLGAGRIYQRTAWYGDGAIGDAPEMIRYTMGAPLEQRGGEGNETWRYRQGGKQTVIGFSGGRVVRIACTAQTGSTASCPDMFGLTDRSGEYDVLVKLGHPDRVSFEGEIQVAHYDGLGLSFGYLRRQVYMIQASSRRDGLFSTFARYARILIP